MFTLYDLSHFQCKLSQIGHLEANGSLHILLYKRGRVIIPSPKVAVSPEWHRILSIFPGMNLGPCTVVRMMQVMTHSLCF